MQSIIAIIPARYASSRFPGKPLADIGGKSMIQRVYEQAAKAAHINQVVVATDNLLIYDHVKAFGGAVVMTNEKHASGTDRCYEALTRQPKKFDYVINVQGDEPFIQPEQINLLARALDGKTEIATLAKRITDSEPVFNPNIIKVVFSKEGNALYFSRSPIPHVRNRPEVEWPASGNFFKHIGLYAYRSDVLEKITRLPVSALETAEALEQLRWLENGYSVKVIETQMETMGIDVPEDVEKAHQYLEKP
ncbi:MAG: 3-deoxy-manno-octulosonate cytidylyltransferase [Flammeovirgaceae bacterium]|nr:MAG: 3-deoxy-manno-octulosonate cytidylyltransferase [Flammeovirgaceae bacterium]